MEWSARLKGDEIYFDLQVLTDPYDVALSEGHSYEESIMISSTYWDDEFTGIPTVATRTNPLDLKSIGQQTFRVDSLPLPSSENEDDESQLAFGVMATDHNSVANHEIKITPIMLEDNDNSPTGGIRKYKIRWKDDTIKTLLPVRNTPFQTIFP